VIRPLIKQALNRMGLEVHKRRPPAQPWVPPDPALLPDYHLYNPRYSPWQATEGDFLARQARHCAGEFWECGVYKGGTAMLLKQVLADCDQPRVLRLFDTFEGLPDADPGRDFHRRGQFADTSQAEVAARVGGREFVHIHAGRIPATFAGLSDARIAFAHVDVDLYESVRDCCEFIYPRLSPGAVMIFDDYGRRFCPGARKAVDEYFEDKPEVVLVLGTGQGVVTALPISRAGADVSP
jgi:O-methyltransferase